MNEKDADTQTMSRVLKENEYNRFEKVMLFSAIAVYVAGICVGMGIIFGPRMIWSEVALYVWVQAVIGIIVMGGTMFGAFYIVHRVRSYNRARRGLCEWNVRDIDALEKRIKALESDFRLYVTEYNDGRVRELESRVNTIKAMMGLKD